MIKMIIIIVEVVLLVVVAAAVAETIPQSSKSVIRSARTLNPIVNQ